MYNEQLASLMLTNLAGILFVPDNKYSRYRHRLECIQK